MNAGVEIDNDLLFSIKTIKGSSFRTLIEALKDILTETNIEIDPAGIKIKSMDGTHIICVHMFLEADRFDEYYCPQKQIIGVNTINLFKLVKTMSNTESIVLYMRKSDPAKLGIEIMNGVKQMITRFSLNLMELDILPVEIPTMKIPTTITMASSDFQKIIRDMMTLGEIVDIQSTSQELVFRCKGDYAEQETIFSFGQNGLTHETADDDIIQGNFSLKYLSLFTKCTSLCSNIKIYLMNNFPIIVEYNVAGLGDIKLVLVPSHAKTYK